MPGVLEGIKIAGITTWAAMPSACVIMADWGAEVIKIEHPSGGDPQRAMVPETIGLPPCPVTPLWESDSRNQKSIALDLTQERARQIVYKLVETSDVFVANLQEPSLKKLGMDYDILRQVNPRLIYAHFSGYGRKGPDWAKPGFDHSAFWASSGIMATLGEPDQPPPLQRPAMGDHIAALAIAGGIAAALFARERTGRGQRVDTCLLSLGMWVNAGQIAAYFVSDRDIRKTSRRNAINPLRNIYRCRDDRWVQFAITQPDRFWPSFCRALGIENLEHDSRFSDAEKRAQNCQELISVLDDVIASKDYEQWKKSFDEWELVWAPVNTVKDIATDPQALANEFVREIRHPELGTMKVVASPLTFSEAPCNLRLPAPRLGEHTEEVLHGMGYTADEIARLRQDGVIT